MGSAAIERGGTRVTPGFPSLDVLGRDLLSVPAWRRAVSLALPFVFASSFLLFAANGWWMALFIPHEPHRETDLTRTRLFRSRLLSIVALAHLYHLEQRLLF